MDMCLLQSAVCFRKHKVFATYFLTGEILKGYRRYANTFSYFNYLRLAVACLLLVLVSTCVFNESSILCHKLGSNLFQAVNVLGWYKITLNSNCKNRVAHLSRNVRYIRP